MTEFYFLGVDGGASTCRARIAEPSGRMLGEGLAGPANTRLGIDRVFGEILAATRQALDKAGLGDLPLNRLHAGLGLAGLALEADTRALLAHPHPFASVTVNTDAYTACLGAHAGGEGGIFIFGTGSCGCAIIGGRAITVGGWGFQVSDHGSGAHVGRDAVRIALLAHEGVVPPTDFSRAVMHRFDGSPEKAVLWAAEAKAADYGTFAPLAVTHAAAGDTLAAAILRATADDAALLLRRLHGKGAARIALVGGFSGELAPWLPDDVRRFLVPARGDALDGAIHMARAALRERGA